MTAPVISVLPDAPQRGVDSQEVFTSKANALVDSLETLVSETNTMGTWMNTTASEVDSDRIASAASATAAASSSSSASSSATTATTKASEASSSATSASSSAVVASTAATTATTKASEASSSASSASTSAATATTKASEASASAASASGSASTSSTQAAIAIQKATEAGNSANSAAASAANAALSLGDYRGDYYAPTSYIAGQSVSYNGSIYIAKQGTTGNLPTNTTYWFKGTGAAAVYDVTASPTDTTAGRLLKVGDFGLGSNLAALPLATLDDTSLPTGNYWSNPDTLGIKPIGALFGFVTIFNEANNDVARQVYRETFNNDVYERFHTTTSGGWQPWERVLQTNDVTTSATDATAGRLMKVGDFGVGGTTRGQFSGDNNSIGLGFNAYFAVSSTNGFQLSDRAFTLSQNYGSSGAAWIAIDRSSGTPWFRTFDGVNYKGWYKGLHTGNILGTVSQSGGVPTGSIIERGSNANGEFVKFADGTWLGWVTRTFTGGVVNPTDGSSDSTYVPDSTPPVASVGETIVTVDRYGLKDSEGYNIYAMTMTNGVTPFIVNTGIKPTNNWPNLNSTGAVVATGGFCTLGFKGRWY